VALVADALRDCSSRGNLVLDPFLGSGTAVIAAEKIGRRCFGLDYEPAFVDVAIRRWQAYAKADAILEGDGRSFDEIAQERERREDQEGLCASCDGPQPTTDATQGGDEDWVALAGQGFGENARDREPTP
jgi:hypothetical protein